MVHHKIVSCAHSCSYFVVLTLEDDMGKWYKLQTAHNVVCIMLHHDLMGLKGGPS